MSDDGTRLFALLRPLYIEILSGAWDDAAAAVGMDEAFSLDNPLVQETLQELAKLIRSVTDTTRVEVRTLVGQSAREGWTPSELAFRIAELTEIRSRERGELIARTESASAYSRGSLLAYQESGVVSGVQWLVTEPCEECQPLADKIVPLGETFDSAGTRHPPKHPACRCAISPVVQE